MATSQQKTALRQYRREHGLCVHCGNAARPDRKMCQTCADKDRENEKRCLARKVKQGICSEHGCSNKPKPGNKTCDSCNGDRSRQTDIRRDARVSAGLCAYCDNPRWNGTTRCEACNQNLRDSVAKLHNNRIAKGCCGRCGDHVLVPGYKRCQPCIDEGRQRHASRKLKVLDAYGGPICVGCGETEVTVLQMDHINGGGHAQALELGNGNAARGRGKLYKWLQDNGFPPGFRVLCANCNIRAARSKPFPNATQSQS